MKLVKFALITGASSGIGEAVAKSLAKQGYSLLLLARRLQNLQALEKEIHSKFPDLKIILGAVDVQNRTQVEGFFQQNVEALKSLELLVNNAGLAKGSDKLQDGHLEDWDQMIDTNVKGLLNVTKAALPFLVARGSGHIVNMGSVAGRWIYPGGAVYCASKSAVSAITEGLRMDLLGKNIRVSNIEPGMVQTEFSKVRFNDADKAEKVYAGMKPLTAEDIAETISWVVARPAHVNIQELGIYPTDQASVRDVLRSYLLCQSSELKKPPWVM